MNFDALTNRIKLKFGLKTNAQVAKLLALSQQAFY